MRLYTFEIGIGDGHKTLSIAYSKRITAPNLQTAIFDATVLTRTRGWRDGEETVRLLEEGGDDPRVVWVLEVRHILDPV